MDRSNLISVDAGSTNVPNLNIFCRNLTNLAKMGVLDPVVGREIEIRRMAQILSRRKKNNPVLIGDGGVGKTAIVEGLALRIVNRDVPISLIDKVIMELDINSVVAGTKYRGQFEERMKLIIEELKQNKNIIIFIDEVHIVVGAGGTSNALDAANILKPALSRGEIQCIGASTLDEYRQYIEKDGALERRFQKIVVNPSTVEETLIILKNIKNKYEGFHNVVYTEDAIFECVKLAERYIIDRKFPDKAIDILDEAGSITQIKNIEIPEVITSLEEKIKKSIALKHNSVNIQDYEAAAKYRNIQKEYEEKLEVELKKWKKSQRSVKKKVTVEKVREAVSMITGIPLTKMKNTEIDRLLNMDTELSKSVIGQDSAIEELVKAIRRNKLGLNDPNKPIGSFIFMGPTGVGKTHLCKEIARILFDKKESLIRIDMSEYMDKFNSSKLIGAPPGYVGYESGGQLTEKVRRNPYCVILFDEIEKAHSDVFNMLLQILDDGTITDGLGRKIDFKNTIIVMTSNIGQKKAMDFGNRIGFKNNEMASLDYIKSIIDKEIENKFSPEFLNRIDDIILFKPLTLENMYKIFDIEFNKIRSRVKELGYNIEISNQLKERIIKDGFDPKRGARPLKRLLQKYIEDLLADNIMKNKIKYGSNILIDLTKKEKNINSFIKIINK